MLTIKPDSSARNEPDPTLTKTDGASVIFVTDEPKKEPVDDNDEVQPLQLAACIQGSQSGAQEKGATNPATQKIDQPDGQEELDLKAPQDTHLDTSSKALTYEHKKGLKDLTMIKEQPLADESIQQVASAVQIAQDSDVAAQDHQISDIITQIDDKKSIPEKIAEPQEKQQKKIDPIQEFNRLVQERAAQAKKQAELTAVIPSKKVSIEPTPKIESKKHRPIEVGSENSSKIELTKHKFESFAPKKKKVSLQNLNLQEELTDFMRKGNAQYSSSGNAAKDDEMGLKHKSYMNQISNVYHNSYASYPIKYIFQQDRMPSSQSIINMIIERSGKVTFVLLQSSGDDKYDEYHMKVLKFMGDFPPIPKFIAAPLAISSIYEIPSDRSFGSYQPKKLQF